MVFVSGNTPWNKGLTKQISVKVQHISIAAGKTLKRKHAAGHIDNRAPWTAAVRAKQSAKKKKMYSLHPEKHPNRKLANNRVKMSYPERLVYDWLLSNNVQFQHQSRVGQFYPDFVVNTTILEIDGEYWHKENNETDVKKDEFYESTGFTVIRIKAKDVLNGTYKVALQSIV